MAEQCSGVDRISGLPEEIIHHILSFLPTNDAHKTSVLSKFFLTCWSCFPVIAFDYNWIPYHEISLFDRNEEFKNAIHRRVQRMKLLRETHYVRKLQLSLPRYVGSHKTTKDHRIDEAICFAIENGVEELNLNLGPNYYPFPVIPGSSCSIRILNLMGLELNNLHHLISGGCLPVIETLCINSCTGLRNLHISSTRIRSIELRYCDGLENIEVGSSSLETFVYHGNRVFSNLEINISTCTFLKVLSLEYACITEKWVDNNIPQLIQLQDLKLNACHRLRNLRISNGSLKRVELLRYRDLLRSIEIVGRNVVSVNFDGSHTCVIKFIDTPQLISFTTVLH